MFAQQVALLIEYLRERQVVASYPVLLQKLENLPIVGRVMGWVGADVSITAEQVEEWLVERRAERC